MRGSHIGEKILLDGCSAPKPGATLADPVVSSILQFLEKYLGNRRTQIGAKHFSSLFVWSGCRTREYATQTGKCKVQKIICLCTPFSRALSTQQYMCICLTEMLSRQYPCMFRAGTNNVLNFVLARRRTTHFASFSQSTVSTVKGLQNDFYCIQSLFKSWNEDRLESILFIREYTYLCAKNSEHLEYLGFSLAKGCIIVRGNFLRVDYSKEWLSR